jgi:hypothetical protein
LSQVYGGIYQFKNICPIWKSGAQENIARLYQENKKKTILYKKKIELNDRTSLSAIFATSVNRR